jgi:hypothetical protein
MEALSSELRVGLQWELFMQMICVCLQKQENLMVTFKHWKEGMELKWLQVNMDKTKTVCCKGGSGQVENSGNWPCEVCSVSKRSWRELCSMQAIDPHKMQWTVRKFMCCWF